MITDGSSQTVLSGGLNVAGVSATGAQLTNASGAVTFTAGGPLSVDGGSGGTTGIVLADGTDQTTDLAGDLTVNANGGAAVGVISTGASGAVYVNAQDGFNVTTDGGYVTGLILADGSSKTDLIRDGLHDPVTGATRSSHTRYNVAATFTT